MLLVRNRNRRGLLVYWGFYEKGKGEEESAHGDIYVNAEVLPRGSRVNHFIVSRRDQGGRGKRGGEKNGFYSYRSYLWRGWGAPMLDALGRGVSVQRSRKTKGKGRRGGVMKRERSDSDMLFCPLEKGEKRGEREDVSSVKLRRLGEGGGRRDIQDNKERENFILVSIP